MNVKKVSSSDLKVLNIVARWPGATHDQTIFRHSSLHDRFEAGDFGRYILIGDSGYANTPYLATPHTANNREIADNPHMQEYQAASFNHKNAERCPTAIRSDEAPITSAGVWNAY